MTDIIETIDVDLDIQEILLAASQHNIPKLRQLLRSNHAGAENPANIKDTETGYSPLHAAIAACEPDDAEEKKDGEVNGEEKEEGELALARETVKFLLQEGAIWNDLDKNDETPGCLARKLGLMELYELMVDAGVRAELLFNRLEGYEMLVDDDDDDEEEGQKEENEEKEHEEAEHKNVTNVRYLHSNLTFQNDRLLDNDQNGVMMSWESDIMRKTALKILPAPGLRVLNIGHGMGIVDGFFQDQSPATHHIVEAHAEVIEEMRRKGWHEKPGVVIHHGRWQDILPQLVEQGELFDAIYYDTFAESYADFREFLSEQVIGLLDSDGLWSFFNGMGADRQISYDVYQKVVEMDVFEAGFDVAWEDVPVPPLDGEWNGVRRKYWVVDNYRLPLSWGVYKVKPATNPPSRVSR
ncbi:arginine N-methyltransferase (Rmt2), putative [Talaromyces stipitatus ATCC 10500]|uniref:Arginine N-methyltransferase 2 n=1 Tax=Talaromyces stipitatus (strain ATCC 10500 / CBS 375.48 / QM 6759 / NRRL 1006) TaxID=441959 RepID=B8LT32_TALSN|nr:arginine N-methyltransferase (Rmt2), putative [Talaromyces stipitatus ATCC 10500]EED23540.1 arginine N-methyltransferase (Rmt2), putative [Talaromyces stipitatus ATCC 10500]